MQRTASSSEDVEQEPTDDEEEEALDQVAHQVPRLQDMCRAFVYSNMRQKASRTLLSNLPEEAAVSVSNIKHLLMTSVDVRKAFSHGHNLDRHLEEKVDHALRSVLFKAVLAHGMAYHTIQSTDKQRIHFLDGQSVAIKTLMDNKPMPIVLDTALDSVRNAIARHNLTIPSVLQVATTAYHNELIVLWGLSKASKDIASLATECAEKLLHSLSEEIDDEILLPYALMVDLAPMTAAEKPCRPPGLQAGNILSCHFARLHANIESAELPTEADIDIFATPVTPSNSPCHSSSCNVMAAASSSSSQQADSEQGNSQQTNQQACPDPDATAPAGTQPKRRKGQMTLKWTFGQGSGVGCEFEVLARWLNPDRSAAAALEKESIQCTATKLINPEVHIYRKSCVGLMAVTSIEKVPSIDPSEVVRQMISSNQLDRVRRILRSLKKAMVISASNLVLYHQQNTPDLALATYEDLLTMPEAREQLHLFADASECLFIIQLSKPITQKPFTTAKQH